MTARGRRFRIGVDNGGTFTDVVVVDVHKSEWHLFKTLSDHDRPSEALHRAFAQSGQAFGCSPRELLAECEIVVLGSTVGTNALLQNRGARVGLLLTRGHEDALEIREGHKEDGHRYDWGYPPATMLVPRYLRAPIQERVLSDGTEFSPLKLQDVEDAVEKFRREGVESVGICFLWSFVNPDHERAALEIAARAMPEAYLCASHDVLPVIGDYNRVSTVAVNAYLGPVVGRFVESMEVSLAELGYEGAIRYLQGNGGVSSGAALVRRSVYALNSGPAAGPSAGSHYAKLYGRDVITADAGGTSFDVGLVHAGETDVRLTSDVARYRIGIPLVNVETLGAGGGSIARIDSRGLLAVGPESAEADPGPACYALGGSEPTVTDALVVLGYLSRVALLGGRMPIDATAAVGAIEKNIAAPLGISIEEAAFGIVRVTSGSMVGGMRRVSIERGYDARDAVLVAVGGVGPAFACRLADELEMSPVVIPRVASGFCAFGAVVADLKHDHLTTYTVPLADADLGRLNAILADLEARGRGDLAQDALGSEIEIEVKRTLELRYIDQLHNCRVPMPAAEEVDEKVVRAVREAFDRRHEALYTYCEPENDVLLVTVHCSVIGRRSWDTSQLRSAPGRPAVAAKERTRSVYWGASGEYDDIPVLGPADLTGGGIVRGPLIVSEETTTIVVEPGWEIRLDGRDFYELASTGRTTES